MKKFLLASLVAMTLLLPALNNTSNAAGKLNIKQVNGTISDYIYMVTSDTSDGQIMLIEIYNLSTGVLVRSQQNDSGYEASISLKGLPHGGYSAKIYCENIMVTRQLKL